MRDPTVVGDAAAHLHRLIETGRLLRRTVTADGRVPGRDDHLRDGVRAGEADAPRLQEVLAARSLAVRATEGGAAGEYGDVSLSPLKHVYLSPC